MVKKEQSSQQDGQEAETCDVGQPRGESSSTPGGPGSVFRSRPDKIGNYKIKRAIASGGMGTVYEAVQEQPRRTVAVKVMKQGLASRSALRRFEYESQILARLRHPGIAAVYEAGMHDDGEGGVPYFAMEYIAGAKDLFEFASAKNLGTRERLELFIKVCEAIHHGHQKGIIHRDLKPANILVDSTGQPKIIDFGVARATDSDRAVTTLQTDVGQLVGTVQYMSPEQIDADPHDIDTRSDVYALGVVLYKLLTKQLPYDVTGTVIYEATRMIREEKPQRVSSIDKSLRGDVETIVLHALEKDRDRRYQSAQELALDIRRYLENRTILARPPSAAYQLRIFVKRNKVLVGATAAVFLALVGGTIGTATGWRRAVAGEQEQARLRDVAERRFDQVRALAHTFLFDFHDAIQELEGAVKARELIVESALKYLDALAKDATDNPTLLLELSQAYDKVGDIQGGIRNPSLGVSVDALRSYRTALELRQAGSAAAPGNRELQIGVGVSRMKVGDILQDTGDVAAALAEYRQALAIFESVAATDDSWQLERRRTAALVTIGNMILRTGHISEARAHFEQAVESRRSLAADPRAELDLRSRRLLQRDLSVALIALGNAFHEAGLRREAIERFEEAINVRAALDREESNGRSRRDLAIARYCAGSALLDSRQPSEALAHLDAFLEVCSEQSAADSKDARMKRDLAMALEAVGRAQLALGDVDAAGESFRQAQATIAPLQEASPENTGYAELAARIELRLGELAERQGERTDASSRYRRALEGMRAITAKDATDIPLQTVRADVEIHLGRLLGELDETDEARRVLGEARSRLGALRAGQPESAAVRDALTRALIGLSTLSSRTGDGASARTHAVDAVDTSQSRDPECLRALAAALHGAGDDAGAAEALREALELIGPDPGGRASDDLRRQLQGELARLGR